MSADREPFYVHCAKCQHEWALGFFPMPLNDVAKMSKVTCPVCKSKLVKIGPLAKPTAPGKAYEWLRNGDTGTSSETIWAVMMRQHSPKHGPDIPYDPSDFGRCYRLLKVMPEWVARMPEVAAKYPKWKPFVDAWDELTAMYEKELPKGTAPKLYARMKELRA